MTDINKSPSPGGDLALQIPTRPADTNADGDIYGGWLLEKMETAGAIYAGQRACSRVAMVAVNTMAFLTPVEMGDVVSCYVRTLDIGRSSIRVLVEVWVNANDEPEKVTEGEFVYVALDDEGRTRPIEQDD